MERRLGRGVGLVLLTACVTGCPLVRDLANGIAVAALVMAFMVVALIAAFELTFVLLAVKLEAVGRIVAAVLGLLLGAGHLVGIALALWELDFWGTEDTALAFTSVLAGGCVAGCVTALARLRVEEVTRRRWVGVGAFVGVTSAGIAAALAHRAHDPWRRVPSSEVVEVDVAGGHGCALHVDGVVACWTHDWPVVVEGVSDAVEIVVDARGGCALDERGRVSCWQSAPPTTRLRAAEVATGIRSIAGVDLGANDSVRPRVTLVTDEGRVSFLGVGTTDALVSPVVFQHARQHDEEGCGSTGDGALWCWRRPHAAERVETSLRAEHLALTRVSRCVGTAAGEIACTSGRFDPVWTSELPGLVRLEGGTRHVCARTRAGEVWCWGNNDFGQLGLGDLEPRPVARRVPLPEPARALTVNEEGACVVLESGAAHCWGRLPSFTLQDPGRARVCKRSQLLGDVWCVPSPSRLRW